MVSFLLPFCALSSSLGVVCMHSLQRPQEAQGEAESGEPAQSSATLPDESQLVAAGPCLLISPWSWRSCCRVLAPCPPTVLARGLQTYTHSLQNSLVSTYCVLALHSNCTYWTGQFGACLSGPGQEQT